MALRPETALRRMADGRVVEVPAADLRTGDVVVLRPGARVPADAVIISGRGSLDEANITGESMPVAKEPGAQIFEATVNIDGVLEATVTKTVAESTVARMIALVTEAQAAKAPSERFTEAVREHHERNRLNSARRSKSLLSGLIFCGCWGGPYSLRGADRFACSAHMTNGSCSNSRTIPREELERRVLAGLKDRMMAPEVAAEAMRAHAEETNRLNRERRSNGDAWKAELAKVEKEIRGIIEAIKEGMFQPSMKVEMDALEARKVELTALLADVLEDTPDLLPSAALIYAKKVGRLTEALNRPEERAEAAEALRMLIEKIVLTPARTAARSMRFSTESSARS